MRSRLLLLTLAFYLIFSLGCTSKPATDNSSNANPNTNGTPDNSAANNEGDNRSSKKGAEEAKRQPIIVPARTTITVALGSALGSKLSQSGQTFTATIAKDVIADDVVAIPRGTTVTGTVVDAKPLGRFAGGAVLSLRVDSMNVNGADMPVQTAMRTFTAKGKGKRTAVMAGGGAAFTGRVRCRLSTDAAARVQVTATGTNAIFEERDNLRPKAGRRLRKNPATEQQRKAAQRA